MKIDSIDHVVLTVKDITATGEFYSKVLGMEDLPLVKLGEKLWLRITEDQSATIWAREYSDSGEANTRFSRSLFCYLYAGF